MVAVVPVLVHLDKLVQMVHVFLLRVARSNAKEKYVDPTVVVEYVVLVQIKKHVQKTVLVVFLASLIV